MNKLCWYTWQNYSASLPFVHRFTVRARRGKEKMEIIYYKYRYPRKSKVNYRAVWNCRRQWRDCVSLHLWQQQQQQQKSLRRMETGAIKRGSTCYCEQNCGCCGHRVTNCTSDFTQFSVFVCAYRYRFCKYICYSILMTKLVRDSDQRQSANVGYHRLLSTIDCSHHISRADF